MRRHCQFTVKQSPKCAVRDGVELLVLAAGDPVANVASKGRAKDAKYQHGHQRASQRIDLRLPRQAVQYAHFEDDDHGENPNTCAENTESDNTSNHLNDLHNPMRPQCQFTVKRPNKRVDLTVATEQQPCGV